MRFGLKLKDVNLGKVLICTAIVLGAISLATPELAFAVKSEQDHWESTKLSEADLRQFVNQTNCYQNENNFLGCIAAFNSLLQTSAPVKILSNRNIETLPSMKETVKVVERLQIKNYSSEKSTEETLDVYWQRFIAERKTITKSWKSTYALTKSKPLNIDQILKASIEIADKSYFKSKIAAAITAYYGSAIDPHTHITTNSILSEQSATTEQNMIGVGTFVQKFGDKFVLDPIEGTPADEAGIQYLDVLRAVNGKNISDLTHEEILNLIRGPERTSVTLSLSRQNEDFDVVVSRAKYKIKNISSKLINDPARPNVKIGYIKMTTFFQTNICKEFISMAKELHQNGAEALILDLRNNPGGFVNEATCIASAYLDQGRQILTYRDPITNQVLKPRDANTYVAQGGPVLFNLYKKPLFIIQNARSASASELLTGSLGAYGRAITIGERSYGKGTFQGSVKTPESEAKGYVIRKTLGRFHFASGATNQITGLTPDFEAYTTPTPTAADMFAMREADLYPNAIETAQPARGFPRHGVVAIQRCLNKRNLVTTEYGLTQGSQVSMDYQLLVAREVASCQISGK